MKITFEEVSVKATKRWKDENGKRRQETRVFSQTINPFNLNADGSPKSRAQILDEVLAECQAWLKQGET